MTDVADRRHRLRLALDEQLGHEGAATLMDMLERGASDQLATRTDIAELRAATTADMAELRTAIQRDMAELRTATQRDISELRSELHREVAGIHRQLAAMQRNLFFGLLAAQAGFAGLVLGLG